MAKGDRFVVKQKTIYGGKYFDIVDSTDPDRFHYLRGALSFGDQRAPADAVAAEMNRDPKVVPGVRVRFKEHIKDYGSSELDALHRVTGDTYGAGDEGVLAFPHPNQKGCPGWWFVEVDSKTGDPRKLYVGVTCKGLEILED